jgi:hypothetical protein
MNNTDPQLSSRSIDLREIAIGHLTLEKEFDRLDISSGNVDISSTDVSVSSISDDNIFESTDSGSTGIKSDRPFNEEPGDVIITEHYDITGVTKFGLQISPKIDDTDISNANYQTSNIPLDVFNNTHLSDAGSKTSNRINRSEESYHNKNKNRNSNSIMHKIMDSSFTEGLLNKCGMYEMDPTLHSLVNNMIKFVRTSFVDYDTYCDNKLIRKYKNLIDIIVTDINRVMNILAINGQDQKLDNIVIVYNETKSLLSKLSLKEDNTYDYLIKKIIDVIRINQNIIIITSLWRKNLDINIIIQSGIEIFHSLIDTVILPLKNDLTDTGMNAMVYEPRILTDSGSVIPSHTQTSQAQPQSPQSPQSRTYVQSRPQSQSRSPAVKYIPASDLNSNSIRSTTLKRSGSMEYASSRRHDTEDDPYIGDFTSKKPMSFDQLNSAINASYGNTDTLESSTAIDILSMYLKGQKILYTEGKNYCERYLNMLMIPAIIIVSIAGLMAQVWINATGRLIISILTAINILLLTLISYLKLDAKAEAHKTSATNYGLLEMKCQFLSGKIMYVDTDVKLNTIIDEIEKKVIETKTANQFVLPDSVIAAYPEIYNTNVFAKVKIMFITEIVMRNELKNTVNKLHFMSRLPNKTPQIQKDLQDLEILQDKQLNEIIEYKKNYLLLDKPFTEEIEKNIVLKKARWYCCFGLFDKLTCGCCYKLFFWATETKRKRNKSSFENIPHLSTRSFDDTCSTT